MDHSIAARYAARPAARFVRPSARVKERRLGLRPVGTFRALDRRSTVLYASDAAPLVRLRASWRAIHPAVPKRALDGRPRPQVIMVWTRSGRAGTVRRPGATSALWPV